MLGTPPGPEPLVESFRDASAKDSCSSKERQAQAREDGRTETVCYGVAVDELGIDVKFAAGGWERTVKVAKASSHHTAEAISRPPWDRQLGNSSTS